MEDISRIPQMHVVLWIRHIGASLLHCLSDVELNP